MVKKYAVIGGAGFIGSHIVDRLISSEYDVVVVDDLSTGKVENINKKAELVMEDISTATPYSIYKIIRGCDAVFLTAAKARVQPSFEEIRKYNEVNVIGLLNVLDAMVLAGIDKLIYSSSSSVYGNSENLPIKETEPLNPISPYASQKAIAEQYIRYYTETKNIKAVCLRYFNVYGERMPTTGAYTTVIGKYLNSVLERNSNFKLPVTNDGNQRRDFTYVEDVVTANIQSLRLMQDESSYEKSDDCKYSIFNVGTGKNTSVIEIVEMFNGSPKFIGDVVEPRETLANSNLIKDVLGWYPTGNLQNWISQKLKGN